MDSQHFMDHVVLWNAGMCIVYARVALAMMISLFQMSSGLQTSAAYSTDGFGANYALAIFALLFAITAGVLNILYGVRYISGDMQRSKLGFAAIISFILLVCFEIFLQIRELAGYANTSGAFRASSSSWVLDVLMWVPLIFDFINLTLGVLLLSHVVRTSESLSILTHHQPEAHAEDDIVLRVEAATHATSAMAPVANAQKEEQHVAKQNAETSVAEKKDETAPEKKVEKAEGDAATKKPEEDHRGEMWNGKEYMSLMEGVELRTDEQIAEEKKKQEIEKKPKPKPLSVNPDNKMLGKINQSNRALAIEAPIFAAPEDAVSAEVRQRFADEIESNNRYKGMMGERVLRSNVQLSSDEKDEAMKDDDAAEDKTAEPKNDDENENAPTEKVEDKTAEHKNDDENENAPTEKAESETAKPEDKDEVPIDDSKVLEEVGLIEPVEFNESDIIDAYE